MACSFYDSPSIARSLSWQMDPRKTPVGRPEPKRLARDRTHGEKRKRNGRKRTQEAKPAALICAVHFLLLCFAQGHENRKGEREREKGMETTKSPPKKRKKEEQAEGGNSRVIVQRYNVSAFCCLARRSEWTRRHVLSGRP